MKDESMTREPDGRNARNVQTSPHLTRPILPYREATVKVFLGTPDGRSVTLDVAVLQNVNLGKRWDRFPRGLSAAWATAIGSVGVALAVSAGITSAIFLLTRQFGTREHRITDAGRDCARLRPARRPEAIRRPSHGHRRCYRGQATINPDLLADLARFCRSRNWTFPGGLPIVTGESWASEQGTVDHDDCREYSSGHLQRTESRR